jgi:hypothetical protein
MESRSSIFKIVQALTQIGGGNVLYTIIVVLVVLWLLGFITHIGGDLIHILLVVALIVFIYDMLTRRRH